MGLFRRSKKTDANDLQRLRAELAVMRTRLDETDQAKAQLEARVGSLDATNITLTQQIGSIGALAEHVKGLSDRINAQAQPAGLTTSQMRAVEAIDARVEELAQRVSATPAFPPPSVDVDQISRLIADVEELRAQLGTQSGGSRDSNETLNRDHLELLAQAVEERLFKLETMSDQVERLSAAAAFAGEGGLEDLRARLDQLARRLDEQPAATAPDRTAELDELRAQIAALNERPEPDLTAIDELREQITALAGRPAAQEPQTDELGIEELRRQIASLAERVAAEGQQASAARERIAEVDARLTNMATELANQLRELGGEIDALGENGPPSKDGGDDPRVGDLHEGQVKLAAEQARYEIAFREDLATLAEQIRRLRG